jgi:hypothetical protein
VGDKAYTLTCKGKGIGTFKTLENAIALKKAIIEDPAVFLEIEEWEPGDVYRWVKFEEDKHDTGRTGKEEVRTG